MPSTFHQVPWLKWGWWRALSLVSVLGALRDVSPSPRPLVLSTAPHRPSSCTDQRPGLHRILDLLMGEFPLRPRTFYVDNKPFSLLAGSFIHSRTIRFNKVLAWLLRTCKRCATTKVSICAIGAPCAVLLAFCRIRILHSCFATSKSLHGTKWVRRRRSMQMQHGRIQPHERMRCMPGIVVDSVR